MGFYNLPKQVLCINYFQSLLSKCTWIHPIFGILIFCESEPLSGWWPHLRFTPLTDWNRSLTTSTGWKKCGWLSLRENASRWKPLRVAAAALHSHTHNPVGEEETLRSEQAVKRKHQLKSSAPNIWRLRGRSQSEVGLIALRVWRRKKLPETSGFSKLHNPVTRVYEEVSSYFTCLSAAGGLTRSWCTGN